MGGYRSLIVYQLAVLIYDLNHQFCQQYLNSPKDSRTVEQMTQAARSGKQNIVEGSLEKSSKMNIKLTGVSRGSFGELLEDYLDFARIRKIPVWDKDDPRLTPLRQLRLNPNQTNGSNLTNLTNWTHWTNEPERFVNLMVTFLSKENYLLDQMLRSLEEKFVRQGGYSENLTRQRLDAKKKQLARWVRERLD